MQQPLVFIDTNILLDFYRQRRGDISLKYLAEIEKKYKSLILTSQVEMEYKKNRQKAILDSLKQIKDETPSYGIPPILSESQPAKMLKKKKKEYQQQEKTLKDRIANILRSPSHSDKVFQSLNRVFKKSWGYHQNREDKNRFKIRKLAIKRFYLGYPPRKKEDNSIGDAINWEYIIDCALRSGKDIIIVSRDGDFGVTYGNKSFLNDWLLKEFKERISTHRKIELTNSLSYAMKQIQSNITDEMENVEKEFIEHFNPKEIESYSDKDLFERIKQYLEKE